MKKEIIAFLQGTRNYAIGVALYNKYGWNVHLKKSLSQHGETILNKKTLIEELRKLAGLSERELQNLKRYTKLLEVKKSEETKAKYDDDLLLDLAKSFNVTVDELVSPEFAERIADLNRAEERANEADDLEEETEELKVKIEKLEETLEETLEGAREKYKLAPEPMLKMIRFREQFPFLNDTNCPDILKILVSDMFTAYDRYKSAYAKLVELPDDAGIIEASGLAENIVENYISNREMWEELEHYQNTGEILGKSVDIKKKMDMQKISKLSDMELAKSLNNARANLSKSKKKLKTATDEKKSEVQFLVNKWDEEKEALTAEVKARNKINN